MTAWPKDNYRDLCAFYGNPDKNGDGAADPAWEAENIVRIVPPYPMFWSWSGRPVHSIAVHRKCSKSLSVILSKIGAHFDTKTRAKYMLDQCGGGYHFRTVRSGVRLSTHAFGAAIDLAPERNGLNRPWDEYKNMMPQAVVLFFKEEGWVWGGDFVKRPDCMHFQAAVL